MQFALFIFLTLSFAGAPKFEVTSLAVVGKHVITSRELALHYFLNRQLKSAKSKSINGQNEITEEGRRGLQELVAQWAIKLEADSFSIAGEKPTGVESKAMVEKFVIQAQSDSSVKFLEISAAEIVEALGRRRQVEEFLKLKSDTRSVVVSEEELKAEFEKNKTKLGSNKPFSQFREQIRESIAREKARSQMADWVDLIQRKYKVRILFDGSQK